jgi:hypothetical protein
MAVPVAVDGDERDRALVGRERAVVEGEPRRLSRLGSDGALADDVIARA